ncbi:hypothetical protein AB0B66_33730 [Catellatospora sp. NPDC049111]|uniref:hypothetical protein n=1 Tax=Catellatospora sp. NPDC049111 TaxID=3155271 RepID=UPI0033CACB66
MNSPEAAATSHAPTADPRRVGVSVASIGGLTAAGLGGLLWITDPAAPPRNTLAFGGVALVGLAAAGYARWASARRAPSSARERLITAWLAVAATNLFALTALVTTLGRERAEPAIYAVAAALLSLAYLNLARARRRALRTTKVYRAG